MMGGPTDPAWMPAPPLSQTAQSSVAEPLLCFLVNDNPTSLKAALGGALCVNCDHQLSQAYEMKPFAAMCSPRSKKGSSCMQKGVSLVWMHATLRKVELSTILNSL